MLYLQRWRIVTVASMGILIALIAIAIIYGYSEVALRIAIRLTARSSAILFVLAFVANPLRQFFSNSVTRWLRTNRRYLGLSMAVSQGFHALAIVGLAVLASDPHYYSNHGGNLGYLFIVLMAATSFRRTAKAIGDRWWYILHTVGMYYLWLAFTVTFADRLSESIVLYLPIVSLLVASLLIRFVALYRNRFATPK